MPTGNEPYIIDERGWIARVAPPKEDTQPARTLLILHGWTGDEKVMWIFTRDIPANTWIFAPRGPVQSPKGGYGWLPHDETRPRLDEFAGVTGQLIDEFQRWTAHAGAPVEPLDVMGFSQGAAMSYALAAYYPQQVNRVIALAGFLPVEDPLPGRYSALIGKKIYIAHGTQDETIPVQAAQEAVQVLQAAGAQVTYCESDAGHKMSAACLRGLGQFLKT